MIMMIIGSNIARAFSLVGALSIIRFRTAIKESRDVAFVFMTMATGMAAGTGFYKEAAVFTIFSCVMVYFLARFDIGSMRTREIMLRVHLPEGMDHHTALDDVFFKHLQDHSLLSVESIRGGTLVEVVYSVLFKKDSREAEFLDEIRMVNGNNKVALILGQANINI